MCACMPLPLEVVRHGFRPTVSIWLISFHIYYIAPGEAAIESRDVTACIRIGPTYVVT